MRQIEPDLGWWLSFKRIKGVDHEGHEGSRRLLVLGFSLWTFVSLVVELDELTHCPNFASASLVATDPLKSHLIWLDDVANFFMPDSLYLSLWFPNSDADEMLPHALSVLRQFPFSAERPGVTYLAVHPVSWNEPTILERRFYPGVTPEEAVLIASDLLHEDYAYEFEAYWDLSLLSDNGAQWIPKPSLVRFIVRGAEFDDQASQQEGQIQIDFGMDSPFLQEQVELTAKAEASVRANVQKLVEFTNKVEKASGASARLLWSESEENFAQKLISRLQKVQ